MAKKILSKEEVLHLAKLAKLSLTDVEIKKNQKQLGETLDYIENLKQINTDKITSDFYTTSAKNVFEEDKISKKRTLSLVEVLKNSKGNKDNYFVVKRIL
jgi:aspartyl-tRNA(Asn)/glutamyl-tRNA(Gln) amidotransferase subunit C